MAGIYSWHDVPSFQASSAGNWNDKSGNSRTVTYTGSVATTSTTGNGAGLISTAVYGPVVSSMTWPTSSITSTTTIFFVNRYNGAARNRIFTSGVAASTPPDLLIGHWNGLSGVCYTNNWLTQSATDVHGNNWAYYSWQNNNIFNSNGTSRKTLGGGSPSYGSQQLLINKRSDGSDNGEKSDYMITEVLIYNRALSAAEVAIVEKYLSWKYGI
jgi:hypothetical protein